MYLFNGLMSCRAFSPSLSHSTIQISDFSHLPSSCFSVHLFTLIYCLVISQGNSTDSTIVNFLSDLMPDIFEWNTSKVESLFLFCWKYLSLPQRLEIQQTLCSVYSEAIITFVCIENLIAVDFGELDEVYTVLVASTSLLVT